MDDVILNIIYKLLISFVIVVIITVVLYYINDWLIDIKYKIEKNSLIIKIAKEEEYLGRVILRLYIWLIRIDSFISQLNYKFKYKFLKYTILLSAGILGGEFYLKNIEYFAYLIEIINVGFKTITFKVCTVILIIIFIKNAYNNSLRRGMKEKYFREVVEEYLKIKDDIIKLVFINKRNEEVIYKILNYCNDEIKLVNSKIDCNYLVEKILNSECDKMEKHIGLKIPIINDLISQVDIEIDKTGLDIILNSNSRIEMIYSVNKKLAVNLSKFSRMIKSSYVLDKRNIAETIVKGNDNINNVLEMHAIRSITNGIKLLELIKNIDRELGIIKKENNILEIVNRVKI